MEEGPLVAASLGTDAPNSVSCHLPSVSRHHLHIPPPCLLSCSSSFVHSSHHEVLDPQFDCCSVQLRYPLPSLPIFHSHWSCFRDKLTRSGASAQSNAIKHYDPETGITYSSITHSTGVTYRVALPANSSTSDAILQIVSPNEFAWCGLAWGGHMTQNPLSVAWATGAQSGQKAIVSSRMA